MKLIKKEINKLIKEFEEIDTKEVIINREILLEILNEYEDMLYQLKEEL